MKSDIRIGKLKGRRRLNRDVEENGGGRRWPCGKAIGKREK